MNAAPSNLKELFQVPCLNLVNGQSVVIVDSKMSIADGCQVLVDNKITCAPVFNKENNSYVGMFDFRDLVDFVLLVFNKKLTPISEDETQSIAVKDIVQQAISGEPINLLQAADLSKKNPFYSVLAEAPLSAAASVLASGDGIHRINVMNQKGFVQAVLSQSAIVKYLASNIKLFPELANKKLNELGIIQSPAITVRSDHKVMEALTKMSQFGLSSIAVVDQGNKLIGNISMSDIKYIFKHSRFTRLWSTCSQFVSMVLSQQGLENQGRDRFPIFETRENATFGQVLGKLVATKVHRIWTVDELGRTSGVISLTDVIRRALEECKFDQE